MTDLLVLLVNYGLAGIVIYIFYSIISNDLKELREEINELKKTIEKLILVLERK